MGEAVGFDEFVVLVGGWTGGHFLAVDTPITDFVAPPHCFGALAGCFAGGGPRIDMVPPKLKHQLKLPSTQLALSTKSTRNNTDKAHHDCHTIISRQGNLISLKLLVPGRERRG